MPHKVEDKKLCFSIWNSLRRIDPFTRRQYCIIFSLSSPIIWCLEIPSKEKRFGENPKPISIDLFMYKMRNHLSFLYVFEIVWRKKTTFEWVDMETSISFLIQCESKCLYGVQTTQFPLRTTWPHEYDFSEGQD